MHFRLVLTLLILGMLLVFALQNAQVVETVFLAWRFELPRSLLLLIVFFGGGLVGWILNSLSRFRRRNR